MEIKKKEIISSKNNQLYCFKTKFNSFSISQIMVEKLNSMGYIYPTKIQIKSIPISLVGCDIMVSSKTGSGKTLCFIIPTFEILYHKSWTNLDKIGGCIICPVRELAIQIFSICKKISFIYPLNVGLLIGGTKKNKFDNNSIIIATIGILCQKILISKILTLDFLKILSVDEVDQILDLGFKRSFLQILNFIPKKKQTLLFSATLTTKLKDIVRLNLNNPTFLSSKKLNPFWNNNFNLSYIIPKSIYQYYCTIDFNEKTNFLYSFLLSHSNNKTIVIFSTNKQVNFFYSLFKILRQNFLLFNIYGGLNQFERTMNFISFNQTINGILFSTDIVSRGLDLKSIDWVVQYDCPPNIKMYLHRVGRTGRLSETGRSLLILTKMEMYFLDALKKFSISPLEIKVRGNQLTRVTETIISLINNRKEIHLKAHNAFMHYTRYIFSVQYNKNPFFSSIDWKKTGENYGIIR